MGTVLLNNKDALSALNVLLKSESVIDWLPRGPRSKGMRPMAHSSGSLLAMLTFSAEKKFKKLS